MREGPSRDEGGKLMREGPARPHAYEPPPPRASAFSAAAPNTTNTNPGDMRGAIPRATVPAAWPFDGLEGRQTESERGRLRWLLMVKFFPVRIKAVARKADAVPYEFVVNDEWLDEFKQCEEDLAARDHYTVALVKEALQELQRDVGSHYNAELDDDSEPGSSLCKVTYVSPHWLLGEAGNQVALRVFKEAQSG